MGLITGSQETERAAGAKRQEETTQAAIRTYVGANAKLKRKLGKSEENASRLEREYTLLLIFLTRGASSSRETCSLGLWLDLRILAMQSEQRSKSQQ